MQLAKAPILMRMSRVAILCWLVVGIISCSSPTGAEVDEEGGAGSGGPVSEADAQPGDVVVTVQMRLPTGTPVVDVPIEIAIRDHRGLGAGTPRSFDTRTDNEGNATVVVDTVYRWDEDRPYINSYYVETEIPDLGFYVASLGSTFPRPRDNLSPPAHIIQYNVVRQVISVSSPMNRASLTSEPLVQWTEIMDAVEYEVHLDQLWPGTIEETWTTTSTKFDLSGKMESGKHDWWIRVFGFSADGERVGESNLIEISTEF
jgi:hypothetical protein